MTLTGFGIYRINKIFSSMEMDRDYSEYLDGPDQLIPCNNLINWEPAGAVKIRIDRLANYLNTKARI